MTTHAWHESHENVVLLCRYLVEECNFDAEELLAVIEKPWKWEDQFKQAQQHACWTREPT